MRQLQYVFQAACPKTHTTESQERKMLLCLDIINNLYVKHAPVFSHIEGTLDTGGLTIDVFFNTAISTTGSQTFLLLFFLAVVCFLLMPELFLVRTTRAEQFGSWQKTTCGWYVWLLVCHVSCFFLFLSFLVRLRLCKRISGVNTR